VFVFFFQAEDGIRDRNVTGVQTCALPIYLNVALLCMLAQTAPQQRDVKVRRADAKRAPRIGSVKRCRIGHLAQLIQVWACLLPRSEERRVGKEGRVASARKSEGK